MVQELSQNSDRDFVAKGDEARDVQDWPRAIANYGHALESDSKVAGGIWVQYGHALKENGQLVDAEQAYKTAQKHSNGDPDPHLHLGHVLKAQGRMNEAESEYADALVLSRGSVDAVVELKDLGWTDAKIRSTLSNIESDRNNKRDGKNILVFDLTDLFQYLGQNRIVTGIQRVQADILEAAMQDQAIETIIVSYSKVSRRWVEVPPDYFALIKNAASRGSDINEKTWSIAIGRLNRVIDNGLYFEFTENSTLINLGTSWDFDNYALTVRNAKIEYNIKYIVFIHDCVPLLFPETCVDEQRRKYTGWVRGVLFEADQVLVNSEATSRDVMHLAEIIKIEIQEPIVCRLDGQYKSAEQTYASEFDLQVLKNLDLVRGSFVLYVSTLEPRKNHLFAFNGWLSMIKRRGLDNVPDLVCVGKTSYFHEILLKHLEASSLLKQRVHLFTNISDIELASLYRSCCFTIYPSRYEGWGLPITEALCHGKTAVVTNISSLPEAGGAFVDYFELGNEPDFTMKVERMIDHRPYLQERENHIATHFEPRSWRDVASDVLSAVARSPQISASPSELNNGQLVKERVPQAQSNTFYSLGVNMNESITYSGYTGEMYRIGTGWGLSQEWGCPFGNDDTAAVALNAEMPDDGDLVFYFEIRAVNSRPTTYYFAYRTSADRAPDVIATETVLPHQNGKWAEVVVANATLDGGPIIIEFSTDQASKDKSVKTDSGGVSGFIYFHVSDEKTRKDFFKDMFVNGTAALLATRDTIELFPWVVGTSNEANKKK